MIHRIVHFLTRSDCPICERAWDRLHADPDFMASLDEGMADVKAGRLYTTNDDLTFTPNPDWPKDGPQPE